MYGEKVSIMNELIFSDNEGGGRGVSQGWVSADGEKMVCQQTASNFVLTDEYYLPGHPLIQ